MRLSSLILSSVLSFASAAAVAVPTPALAASTAFPHIDSSQANYALHLIGRLPGPVVQPLALTRRLDQPCLLDSNRLVTVALPAGAEGGVVTAGRGGDIVDRTLAWGVEVLAFPTPAAVKAYLARFRAAEMRCATTGAYPYAITKAGKRLWIRSRKLAFTKTSHGGWTGYHGVDRLTYDQPRRTERRVWSVLSRGNALVFVTVTDDVRAVSGMHQEQWRQLVQDRLSAALVRLAS